MYNNSSLFKWYQSTIKQMCSYANVTLFTSDSPSPKEKKLEKRCADIIDTFYIASNYVLLYEALNNVKTDLLLGCNDTIIAELMRDYSVLHATLDHHIKDVTKKVKSEPVLVEYYKVQYVPEDHFQMAYDDLVMLLPNEQLDIAECKKMYYDSFKRQVSLLKDKELKLWKEK